MQQPKVEKPVEQNFEFANQTDNAYEALLERILRGELQPGEVVKERPWAGLTHLRHRCTPHFSRSTGFSWEFRRFRPGRGLAPGPSVTIFFNFVWN